MRSRKWRNILSADLCTTASCAVASSCTAPRCSSTSAAAPTRKDDTFFFSFNISYSERERKRETWPEPHGVLSARATSRDACDIVCQFDINPWNALIESLGYDKHWIINKMRTWFKNVLIKLVTSYLCQSSRHREKLETCFSLTKTLHIIYSQSFNFRY